MFKFLLRLLCVATVLTVSFFAISVTTGGKWFRRAGETMGKKGEQAGDVADSIKQMTEGAAGTAKETVQKAKDTGEKIKDLTSEAVGKVKNAAD